MSEVAAVKLLNILEKSRFEKEANVAALARNLFNTLKTYGSNAGRYGKAFFDEYRPRNVKPMEWAARNEKAESFMRGQGGTMPRNRFRDAGINARVRPQVQNNNKEIALNTLAGVGGFGAGYGIGHFGTKTLGSIYSPNNNKPALASLPQKPSGVFDLSNFFGKQSSEKQAAFDLISILGQLGIKGIKGLGQLGLLSSLAAAQGAISGGTGVKNFIRNYPKTTATAGALSIPTGYVAYDQLHEKVPSKVIKQNIKMISGNVPKSKEKYVEPLPKNWSNQKTQDEIPLSYTRNQTLFGR